MFRSQPTLRVRGDVGLSFIGVGGFVRSVMLPMLKGIKGWSLRGVISKGGISSAHVANRYNAAFAGTDTQTVWKDADTHAVIIATRHNTHAKLAIEALKAGKHVWVEKPLALTVKDVDAVAKAHDKSGRVLMVGFNRRFSPALVPLKEKLAAIGTPKTVLIRVNAGKLEGDNWQSTAEGGGRLLGEVCHFTDLAYWLVGKSPRKVSIEHGAGQDNYTVMLRFDDGSLATVIYSSEGDPAAPKERVEVLAGGAVGLMDNYQQTTWSENGRVQTLYAKPFWRGQEKGHKQALAAFISACKGETEAPIPAEEILTSSRLLLQSGGSTKE